MASADDVERAIRALSKRLAESAVEPGAVPERSILCIVPDLNVAFLASLKDARLDGIRRVKADEAADVRITARSDDLVAMIEGRLNVGMAFMLGRVRIDAPAQDLMLIRKLF